MVRGTDPGEMVEPIRESHSSVRTRMNRPAMIYSVPNAVLCLRRAQWRCQRQANHSAAWPADCAPFSR
jgi:hypothetical protein